LDRFGSGYWGSALVGAVGGTALSPSSRVAMQGLVTSGRWQAPALLSLLPAALLRAGLRVAMAVVPHLLQIGSAQLVSGFSVTIAHTCCLQRMTSLGRAVGYTTTRQPR
jgi:hypothetical protein